MTNLSNINNHFIVDTSGKGVFGDVASFSSTQHGPLNVFKSGAAAAICIDSSGGSGRMYQLRSETSGSFVIYDNPSCAHRMEISSGGEVTFSGNVKVTGAFKDSSGDTGTSGQILSSTATGSNWIDNDTGDISGSGTTDAVAKFTGAKAIGDGPITFATNDSTFAGSVTTGTGLKLYTDGSGNGVIYNLGQDKDLYLVGDDGGAGINALVFDMSESGNATFSGSISIGGGHGFANDGNGDLEISSGPSDSMNIISNGSMSIRTGGNNQRLGINSAGTATFSGTNTYNKIQSYYSGSYISGWRFSDYNGNEQLIFDDNLYKIIR